MLTQKIVESLENRLLFSDGSMHIYAGITKREFPELYKEILEISEREFNVEDASDRFDDTYKYLVCIVGYDPPQGELPLEKEWEILSFYRYILCRDARNGDSFDLSTNKFYDYSERFKLILPATLELGRSVVNHNSKMARKGLESIWKGLGTLIDYYKNYGIKFLFGEVSLQKADYDLGDIFQSDALFSIVACYLKNFYRDDLIKPKESIKDSKGNTIKGFEFEELMETANRKGFTKESNYQDDVKILKSILRNYHAHKPQLFFHYGEIPKDGGLYMFPPVDNEEVLECWEMGLLIKIDMIKSEWMDHCTLKGYRKEAFT